jgi:prevent-host-death family protein
MSTQISKSQFKAKALQLFREVESKGESIIITDHGEPVIEIRQYREKLQSPLQVLKGSVTLYLDPTESVAESDWEAMN